MKTLYRINKWYDGVQDPWRFLLILPFVILYATLMGIEKEPGYLFVCGWGVMLGMIGFRFPYIQGWHKTDGGQL